MKKINEEKLPLYLIIHARNKEFSDFLNLRMKFKHADLIRQYTIQSIEMVWDKTFAIYRDMQM